MATSAARRTAGAPPAPPSPVLAPPVLLSPDPAAAGTFYAALLGWRQDPATTGPHGRFRLSEEVAAHWVPANARNAAAAWLPAFAVRDACTAVRRVRAAGGTPLPGSPDRAPAFADPVGGRFVLVEPPRGAGCPVWTELFSTDTRAATAFYRSAFGWRGRAIPFEGGSYTVLTSGPGADGLGGIRQLHAAEAATGLRSHWLPYLEVEDVERAVTEALELGATLRTPARNAPGLGRSARLTDPQGAEFAVLGD
ncbi:VOC family protein [Kitasatospora sp. NPDC088346]|uniref:VOC family protein n=1 Tax=Kitasatospora sp. NPDC088346 TaxID=3364073 RepID=UPI003823315F